MKPDDIIQYYENNEKSNIFPFNLKYLLQLMKQESNLKIIEYIKDKKNVYYTIKVTFEKIQIFLAYCIYYLIRSRTKQKTQYIGLDFEYNNNNIKLCQYSFFPNSVNKYIFVIDPNMFSIDQIEIMIETIFISPIYKIIHGGEGLDLPYIYEVLFLENKKYFSNFLEYVVDTRFLCEYEKNYTKTNIKCSLYDALLTFKVINDEKYKELNEIHNSMGKIYKVNWDLDKLNLNTLKYVLYDVVFLKDLYKHIIKSHDKKYISEYHTSMNIMRFTYFLKYNVLTVQYDKNICKTYEFEKIFDDIIKSDNLKKFYTIDYFKKPIRKLIKLMLCNVLNNVDQDTIYEDLYAHKLYKLIKLLKNINIQHLVKKLNKFK